MKKTIEADVTTASTLPEVIAAIPPGYTVLRWGEGYAVVEPTPIISGQRRTA